MGVGRGNILFMNTLETFEKQAEDKARALAGNTFIRPKRHVARYNLLTGRARYPFKAMIVGDFFLLEGKDHAYAARNALKTFNRKNPTRRFLFEKTLSRVIGFVGGSYDLQRRLARSPCIA
jgi:hypothetical protein